MKVTIKLFASLREKFGKEIELNIQGQKVLSVKEALSYVNELLREVTEDDKPKRMYKILVNGINIVFLDGLSTKVKDGDKISIFSPAGGG